MLVKYEIYVSNKSQVDKLDLNHCEETKECNWKPKININIKMYLNPHTKKSITLYPTPMAATAK